MSQVPRPFPISLGRILMSAFLALYAVLGGAGARTDTPTVDEFAHLPSGAAILANGDFDLYANNPPLVRMMMAFPAVISGARVPSRPAAGGGEWEPWIYGQRYLHENLDRYLRDFLMGRLVILSIAVAGGFLLHEWAKLRHGEAAALVALAFYCLDPNFQAHGRLATTDVACAVLVMAIFFSLERWRHRPGPGRLFLVGLGLGLALLSKFTSILAIPVIFILLWGCAIEKRQDAARLQRYLQGLRQALLPVAGVGLIAIVVLQAGYGFQKPLTRAGEREWSSGALQAVLSTLPPSLPLPFPRPYLEGLDAQAHAAERGEFGCYFAGRWYTRPPLLYHLAALLLKLPLPTIAFILLSIGMALFRKGPRPLDDGFAWLFPVLLIVYFTFQNALPGGIRYLLPALPFLYLEACRPFARTRLQKPATLSGAIALGIVALLLATTVSARSSPLAYFNALAGGTRNGHRWLIDSNLDWGQDLVRVPEYLAKRGLSSVHLLYFGHVEPELYDIVYDLPPLEPAPGTYVISVNFALGYDYLAPDHGRMIRCRHGAPEWLRRRLPDDRIGASLWVYHVH